MTKKEIDVIVGALLHDVGKLLYRTGESKNHSTLGYEFLKERKVENQSILDSVHYHHGNLLAKANIADDSIAYIVYVADNISAASDRRKKEQGEFGFNPKIPMQSVFNILNGNKKNYCYAPIRLDTETAIHMPMSEDVQFDTHYYEQLKLSLEDALKGVDLADEDYISSLLTAFEAYTSYIPSSTATGELADISLYDHVKLTAAYASCIYQYLQEIGETNYKKVCFEEAEKLYEKKAFRMLSMDVSGIQKFIYTIHSSGALKMLRSRSFYLEILMEHMVDELLSKLNLSRANLIFSGGGRCTILIPNTKEVCSKVEELQQVWSDWFIDKFGISLYVGVESVACSAYELENHEKGQYAEIFRKLSAKISKKKSHRYSARQILLLNSNSNEEHTRECKVCKSTGVLDEEEHCPFCQKIIAFSKQIIEEKFYAVVEGEEGLPLPTGNSLCAFTEEELKELLVNDKIVRSYAKNRYYTGQKMASKLWVGDYSDKLTTDQYAKQAQGIDRIAVLRADVDNLGQTFIAGFEESQKTLSRMAALSRQLSLFFKNYINGILKEGKASILAPAGSRKVTIVYSGGDDLFLVGAWNEIIAVAIDIHNALEEFAIGSLHISAGIGVFSAKYPLSVCAREVEQLEENAKKYPVSDSPEKNAICLFEQDSTYDWSTFITKVIGEKLVTLDEFFSNQEERGMAFLYRLLELIRAREDKINLARFAYMLSRLEPKESKVTIEIKDNYKRFEKTMYRWACNKTDAQQLITAIYIYVYLHRKEDDVHETK